MKATNATDTTTTTPTSTPKVIVIGGAPYTRGLVLRVLRVMFATQQKKPILVYPTKPTFRQALTREAYNGAWVVDSRIRTLKDRDECWVINLQDTTPAHCLGVRKNIKKFDTSDFFSDRCEVPHRWLTLEETPYTSEVDIASPEVYAAVGSRPMWLAAGLAIAREQKLPLGSPLWGCVIQQALLDVRKNTTYLHAKRRVVRPYSVESIDGDKFLKFEEVYDSDRRKHSVIVACDGNLDSLYGYLYAYKASADIKAMKKQLSRKHTGKKLAKKLEKLHNKYTIVESIKTYSCGVGVIRV